jgi:curved DNA-binding protein CbpA
LDVPVTAGPIEIRSAWMKKVKEWHPDTNAHRAAEAKIKMARINQAYEMLKK